MVNTFSNIVLYKKLRLGKVRNKLAQSYLAQPLEEFPRLFCQNVRHNVVFCDLIRNS